MQQNKEFVRYSGPRLRGPRTELVCGQEGFPEALCTIADPPERLYVIGDIGALGEGIAIVGARNATPYGISCAKRFARLAAIHGIPVVSGGARGCDAAAHRAALEANGTTVAFLGGGCDELYPASHFGLFQEIVDSHGAVVSEQGWSFPPMKHTFRARNRLIAGLAKATLIVEAGLPSGTFSTADEALAANREVLVVPGSIASKSSRGSNRLLFQGATPIIDDETFESVLDALFGQQALPGFEQAGAESVPHPPCKDAAYAPETVGEGDAILDAICANPMSIEDMLGFVEAGGLHDEFRIEGNAITFLMIRLAELQRSGRVVRYPDGRYGPVVV
ncbi:DNA-processing protein DprA [Raoultibacter phocaeensis]|uniref:DNA-processing protein DprA n=1 Tax=Raoultibacter phocaeensis TaxID=2479841 RepID=UPI00111AF3CB|nr:DNA-processing protein DprA [Raoultibacter phocaeensis]